MGLLRRELIVTKIPEFLDLGEQAYEDTYEQMRSIVRAQSFKDQIWLLEHPSVFTLYASSYLLPHILFCLFSIP